MLINNHLGVEQSCHNDLESIGHVLVYWNGGVGAALVGIPSEAGGGEEEA